MTQEGISNSSASEDEIYDMLDRLWGVSAYSDGVKLYSYAAAIDRGYGDVVGKVFREAAASRHI
tara:strand:- start:2441 stop:2632 length:192 start_codon:yes stop_codon:yes gene_type:complete